MREVYIAAVGLTKVDLTGNSFGNVFDLFQTAYRRALANSDVRAFDAIQLGIISSEEFENRANIAAKVADRLGLVGVPAVRSETASSTGAAAFHEACYKIRSGAADSVLVLAGERMKTVTTQAATEIMSKTVDPVEKRFGCTMPALIALLSQSFFARHGIRGERVADVLSRLMFRAHALGADNPLAAFAGKPETLAAYFDATKNLPVATPLRRKDCSPICDGAAALILTSRPQPVRVAGLGAATDTSSLVDREDIASLPATRRAAAFALHSAGIRDLRAVEGLVLEVHDAFNSLLPLHLVDLGLCDAEEALEALIGSARAADAALDPYASLATGPRGRLPVNLSGGLKSRGHPVGGTGLYQLSELYLQLTGQFPNPRAQVPGARIGIAHSIGGPGNNVYVTVIERADGKRKPDAVARPPLSFRSSGPARLAEVPPTPEGMHGASAVLEAYTSIYVTAAQSDGPIHVGLVRIGDKRAFAKLDQPPGEGEPPEAVLAGQRVRLLVKDDGDHYFQMTPARGFDLAGLVGRMRTRVGTLRRAPEEPTD